jgi:hypothetical protein
MIDIITSILTNSPNQPIDDYYKGMPCVLRGIVGRIVGESEEGSWDTIGDKRMYSIPLFSTPHGTVYKTGISHLSKIDDMGLEKLNEFEKDALSKGGSFYANYLKLPV